MKTDDSGSPPAGDTLDDCRRRVAELEATAGQLKRAEEALSDSVWEWQTTFDAMVEGVCLLEPGGTIRNCNRAFLSLVGRSLREVVGMRCSEVVHGCEEPPAYCPIPSMKNTMARAVSVYQIRGRWYHVTVDPMIDADGRITGTVHLFSDIHEQREAENELRESEERFRIFAEASSEGIVVHEDGVVRLANLAFALKFGYEPGEVIGMHVLDLAAPDFRDAVKAAITTGREGPYEAMGLRKDGSTFWGELRGRSARYRGKSARVTIISDIDERKRAAVSLTESESLYRSLIEAFPHAVAIVQDREFVYMNSAMPAMFGCEGLGEMNRCGLQSGLPVNENVPAHYFTEFARKNGEEFPAEVFAREVAWRGRPALQLLIIDISQRLDLGR